MVSAPPGDVRPRVDSRPGGLSTQRPSFTGRAVVLAIVALTLLVSLAVPVRAWFAQRAEIAGLRADVQSARDRVDALAIQKERWDDPAFVAAEARRRLHFVLPGEVGYVTLGSAAAVAAAAADRDARGPWYSELWGSLQEADDRGAGSG